MLAGKHMVAFIRLLTLPAVAADEHFFFYVENCFIVETKLTGVVD